MLCDVNVYGAYATLLEGDASKAKRCAIVEFGSEDDRGSPAG